MSDTTDYHPTLRRATTWPLIGHLIASHIAHQEGLMAGEDGGDVTDCRYPPGCTLARVWVRAWYAGRDCPYVL